MIPKLVYSDKWLDFWSFGLGKLSGMTIFPFIVLREEHKTNPTHVLVNHESIHIKQQAEGLLIFFALIYYGHWLFNIIKNLIKREPEIINKSYREIIYEVEAYDNEQNLQYLSVRRIFECFRK